MNIEDLYEHRFRSGKMMAHHMPALRKLAEQCAVCVEFGVRSGPSTLALLCGTKGSVVSYDVERVPQWHDPIQAAAGDRWTLRIQPSETATDVPECDLLMHDSFHNYSQVDLEMKAHATKARKFLVFHDTIACAVKGEGITGGYHPAHYADQRGIRLAIDELMIRDPSWHIYSHDPESNGLLVLARR